MATRTVLIVSIAASVALAAAAGLTVIATGGGSDGEGGGFLRHLHALGHHLHGGGHHHDPMAEVIEQLNLTPDQVEHLERIHAIIGNFGEHKPEAMLELHNRLVAQFEQGHIDGAEIRLVVDDHVEQIRQMGYAVTDELVALVNGLDATQRETLLEHLHAKHGGRDLHSP